jgi:hypothetical protein
MEEFVEIKDFEEYKINKEGEIMGKFGRILKPCDDKGGYLYVILMKDGKRYTKKIHRLVGEQFIPNPNNLPVIDHIDGNRQNNSLENLRWADRMTNSNNRIVRGCIFWHKPRNNWKAQIIIFGKLYQKTSKDKSILEEWLKQKISVSL